MSIRNLNTNVTLKERKEIGTYVLGLRKKKKISQKDLAFEIGVSPVRITEIENGSKDFRIDTLIVILIFFDIKLSDILNNLNK